MKAKEEVDLPIIASLNASTFGGWITFARKIEQAGADALELNIYSIPTDPELSSEEIETSYLTILTSVRAQVKIPIAVKLSLFFTNFARFARQLDNQGPTASCSSTVSTSRTSIWRVSRSHHPSC